MTLEAALALIAEPQAQNVALQAQHAADAVLRACVTELAQRAGAGATDLAAPLERLVTIGFVERRDEGGTVCRPVARTL